HSTARFLCRSGRKSASESTTSPEQVTGMVQQLSTKACVPMATAVRIAASWKHRYSAQTVSARFHDRKIKYPRSENNSTVDGMPFSAAYCRYSECAICARFKYRATTPSTGNAKRFDTLKYSPKPTPR